jgi:hypothetical protein
VATAAAGGALLTTALLLCLSAPRSQGIDLRGWALLACLFAGESTLAAIWLAALGQRLRGLRPRARVPAAALGASPLGLALLAQGHWFLALLEGNGVVGGREGLLAVTEVALADPTRVLGRTAAIALPATTLAWVRGLELRHLPSLSLAALSGLLGYHLLVWGDPTALGWLVGIRVRDWTSAGWLLGSVCVLTPTAMALGLGLGERLGRPAQATGPAPGASGSGAVAVY